MHIKQITNKANSNGFLQHNLHNCPLEIKSNCYKAMVNPIILDYAAIMWSPHTQKGYISMIERSQRQAARFVMNNFSLMPVLHKNANKP